MKNNWLIEKERFTEIKLCLQFFDDVPEEIINFLKQADIKNNEKLSSARKLLPRNIPNKFDLNASLERSNKPITAIALPPQ